MLLHDFSTFNEKDLNLKPFFEPLYRFPSDLLQNMLV